MESGGAVGTVLEITDIRWEGEGSLRCQINTCALARFRTTAP
eukprot:COSAG01_NODE_46322_length_401_cov_0.672185_1_plen_41_part_01